MPVLVRVAFLGFQAAALVATVGPGLGPLTALATPIPTPLMPHLANYTARTSATSTSLMIRQAVDTQID